MSYSDVLIEVSAQSARGDHFIVRVVHEVLFEFRQTDTIMSGTHLLTIQVTLPGRDPLRLPIVFEVLDQVVLSAAPASNTAPAAPPAQTSTSGQDVCAGGATAYEVQHGDTLNNISEAHTTTNAVIIGMNPGKIPNPDALRPGTELCLP